MNFQLKVNGVVRETSQNSKECYSTLITTLNPTEGIARTAVKMGSNGQENDKAFIQAYDLTPEQAEKHNHVKTFGVAFVETMRAGDPADVLEILHEVSKNTYESRGSATRAQLVAKMDSALNFERWMSKLPQGVATEKTAKDKGGFDIV